MALKTYTVAHTSEHGWPDVKEMIWDNNVDEVVEWLWNSGMDDDGVPIMVPHRLGGEPACMYSDGSLEWHEYGKRHRTDGPAIINADFEPCHEWFVNDEKVYTWEEFQNLSECSDIEISFLKLKWGSDWEGYFQQ